jgi:hypothetical protein
MNWRNYRYWTRRYYRKARVKARSRTAYVLYFLILILAVGYQIGYVKGVY